MKKIIIINGANLNMLEKREVEIYGGVSFDSYLNTIREKYQQAEIHYFQSNIEGEIVEKIQQAGSLYDAIVINAGAYTHTSIAIYDALKMIQIPVIEVHISNIYKRESFRHHSYISPCASGIIVGMGLKGYALAIESLLN